MVSSRALQCWIFCTLLKVDLPPLPSALIANPHKSRQVDYGIATTAIFAVEMNRDEKLEGAHALNQLNRCIISNAVFALQVHRMNKSITLAG